MTTVLWTLFLLFNFDPNLPWRERYCDEIELNHVHDESKDFRFSQYLFWGNYGVTRHIVGWRILDQEKTHSYVLSHNLNKFRIVVLHNDQYFLVKSPRFKETYTNYDPEETDRTIVPLSERRNILDDK